MAERIEKIEKKSNPLDGLTTEQITLALKNLTPEKLAAIRSVASQAGVVEDDKFRRLPNGDLRLILTIPRDLVEPLLTVCEAAGEPPFDYIHGIALQGINGWFIGGIEDEQPVVTPETKIPIGTTA